MKFARSFAPSAVLAVLVAVSLIGAALAERSSQEHQPGGGFDAADEFADYGGDEFDQYDRDLQATETTRCNFWCMLKNSLAQTVIGLLLICIAPCLMWKNEGRHVRELRRIDFCKNEAVAVENIDDPSGENNGRLVHFVGQVSVDDAALDIAPGTALNLTEPVPGALIVKRTCYIYQRFEDANSETKKDVVGGGQTTTTTYTAREDWTPMGPQPEQLEHLPEETNSRGAWDDLVEAAGGGVGAAPEEATPMNALAGLLQLVDPSKAPHGIAVSPAAHVGGFGLSREVVMEEPRAFQAEWSFVPPEHVPDSVEGIKGLVKGSDGILRTFPEDGDPVNGDVKVVYECVNDGFDCSFIVEQIMASSDSGEKDEEAGGAQFGVGRADVIDDKCCGVCHDDLGVIWMVRRGRHDLSEMIDMAKQEEKAITKLLRILCWVLLVGGWIMLFSIFTTVLNTLPLIGQLGFFAVVLVALIVGTVCCCGVTAIAYMRYRPLISFGILALAGGIYGIVAWRLNVAAEASESQ